MSNERAMTAANANYDAKFQALLARVDTDPTLTLPRASAILDRLWLARKAARLEAAKQDAPS